MNICVIIPAYNQEHEINSIVCRARKILPSVIVVNDGSSDNTAREAVAAGAVVLSHQRNQGKGKALQKGFLYAIEQGYEAVVTLDGDGQHNPSEIPLLLERALEADIVIGSRLLKNNGRRMPFLVKVMNRCSTYVISFLAGTRITDSQSGFRLIKTAVLKQIALTTHGYEAESEQIIKAGRSGFTIKEVAIQTIYLKRTLRPTILSDAINFIKLLASPRLYCYQGSLSKCNHMNRRMLCAR